MRIVCDSCGTKYSIGDDKIKGKVFKIRCKKCSHVIIVRGNNGAEEAEMASPGGGEAVWYVVRGGQQDGPHSPEALSGLLASGEVTAETYTWREGFSDWVPFASVGELSHLLGNAHQEASLGGMDDGGYGEENEATRVAGGLFDGGPSSMDARRAAPAPAASLFEPEATQAYSPENLFQGAQAPAPAAVAATRPEPMMFAPAPVAAAPVATQAFAPEPQAAIAGFSAAAAAPAPAKAAAPSPSGARNGQRSDMVGARSENSVLFSLNTLAKTEANAEQEQAPTNTEASGLIDIRALSSSAAAVSNARSPGNLPDPLAGPMVAGPAISVPDMMPMGTRKSNAPLFAAIGVGLFLILAVGGGLIGYYLYSKDKKPETIVMNNPNAVAANANAEAPKPEVAKAEEPKVDEKKGEAPPAEEEKEEPAVADEKKEEAAPAEGDKEAAARKEVKDERTPEQKKADLERAKEERERREQERKEREAAAALAKKEEKKEEAPKAEVKNSKGGDNIDDIIGNIGKPTKKDPPPAEKEAPPVAEKKETPPPAGQKLDKNAVQSVVRRYSGSVSGCAKGQSGTVMVRFTINPNGSVAGAQVVTDAFKGTPAGGCVVSVVRSMKFPASDSPLTINYPFKL